MSVSSISPNNDNNNDRATTRTSTSPSRVRLTSTLDAHISSLSAQTTDHSTHKTTSSRISADGGEPEVHTASKTVVTTRPYETEHRVVSSDEGDAAEKVRKVKGERFDVSEL